MYWKVKWHFDEKEVRNSQALDSSLYEKTFTLKSLDFGDSSGIHASVKKTVWNKETYYL